MTKEQLAAMLHVREYMNEITAEEAAHAKAAGLLVIFGAGDDLLEVRGALRDEIGANGGTRARLDAEGFIPDFEDVDRDDEAELASYFKRKGGGIEINAAWDKDGYSWVIEAAVPHAVFDIVEDDEKFCRGIVIDASALK